MTDYDNPLQKTDVEDLESIPVLDDSHSNRKRRRRSANKTVRKLAKFFKRSFRIRTILISTFVVVVVVVLAISVLITDATAQLDSSWRSLNRVILSFNATSGTELTLSDVNRLQSSLSELSGRVNTTQIRLGIISPILQMNPDWQASYDSLEVSEHMVNSALALLSGLQPALDYMVQGDEEESVTTGISSGQRLVELLGIGRGRFIEAQNSLRLAAAQLDEIDLSNVSTTVLLQVEQLRAYHTQLVDFNTVALNGASILTTLMGLDDPRSYLVLAQNNDEIRPSGGYVSTYGWFTVDGARIRAFDYSPTTTTSPNPPRADFLNSFEIPSWWIRYNEPIYAAWDGSWYADFPSTARLAMDYYNAGGNPQSPVDGVLAIDITGFELLLGAIGDVVVPEYNTIVNATNFRRVVYDIRAFGQGVTPHKQFLVEVYQAIFEGWSKLDQERLPALLGALLDGVRTRHIMIYFADDEVNSVVAQLGWNGSQVAGIGHDYVMVADANLGNKSNNSVIRSMTYDVSINDDGTTNSRLSLRYDYFDSLASTDPAVDEEYHGRLDYNNLMQVFLPQGSSLLETDNLTPQVVEFPQHTALIGRTTVDYDTSERYLFVYQTPVVVDTLGEYQRYRVLIQKQPGARVQLANVQVTLPVNARLISSSPDPSASYNLENPILDYRLELDGDIWIEVIFATN